MGSHFRHGKPQPEAAKPPLTRDSNILAEGWMLETAGEA
jgi:hypothetical protein